VGLAILILREGFIYSRLLIGYLWLFSILFLSAERILLSQIRAAVRRASIGTVRTLIVGSGAGSQTMQSHLRRLPGLGHEIVGILDDEPPANPSPHGYPVLGKIAALPNVVREHDVKEVLVALPSLNTERLVEIINLCPTDRVHIRVFPDLFQFLVTDVQMSEISGLPLLTVRAPRLAGWHRVAKRIMDIAISAACLILFSGPMLLIAVLVRLDSPGPVFFIQERVGLDGKPFPMIKFRSMVADAPGREGRDWTVPNDPRVTRLGRFLRRYSIDEMPQFINVLLGHMSLVGPRPEQPQYVAQFSNMIPRYMERHREKAGMTGWAQVNGLRGDVPIEQRTQYDLYYIENWSIFFDLRIMLRSLIALFKHPGY